MAKRRRKKQKSIYKSETYNVNGRQYKTCVYCGKSKPIEEFALNGVDDQGNPKRRDDCKTCYNIRRKENKHTKEHSDFIGGQKRRGETDIDYTHQDWKETLMYFGGVCAYCGAQPRRGQILTKDHLRPVSKGGKTTQSNIVPACSRCNSSKGAEDFKEWFMKQPFFSQDRLNRIFKWRTIMRLANGEDGGEEND